MWPLVKDESILALLANLAAEIDRNLWKVVDYWNADLCAVGIASATDTRFLVYVSTWRQPPGTYAYECEGPPLPGSDFPYESVASGEGATFSQLVDALRKHLPGLPE